MTKDFADFLVRVTEDAGNQEVELRENYSGRFMYGVETCAVVVENPLQLISDIVEYVRASIGTYEHDTTPAQDHYTWDGGKVPEPDSLRIDNMGRNQVVIY